MGQKINISGAGLVGSLLSIYLKDRGHDVSIYERRPDMRATDISAGKSINLAMSDRGWKGLEGAGIADDVRDVAIPMYKRVMHAKDGTLTDQAYGKEGQAIYSVSRGGLNARLMDLAEKKGVKLHFNQKCTNVDLDTSTAHFESYETGERTIVEGDALFGTDGAFSAVRAVMQKTDRFSYEQQYIEHGYKELNIEPNEDGSHKLEKNALHIWPRGHYMLIALPNTDGSFTCTLFFPYEGAPSFDTLNNKGEVRAFFEEQFADVIPLMPDYADQYFENPTASLVIIRCFPWSRNGKVCLMGDASHAIVPFYGQGMNSGFEDCSVFAELLDIHGEDWAKIFPKFEDLRKPNADAIADLAMRNFVEMRDLTGDPEFLLQKQIEARFYAKYPEKWMPLYSMVTFSHIPYSEALAEGKRQDKIMAQIMAMPSIHRMWDTIEVEEKMLELLEEYA
jgi:kynurenine 3-monooxygenase